MHPIHFPRQATDSVNQQMSWHTRGGERISYRTQGCHISTLDALIQGFLSIQYLEGSFVLLLLVVRQCNVINIIHCI